MLESVSQFIELSGFSMLTWRMMVMRGVALGFLYLAVYRKFEPLLLVPIAFGALVANLPTRGILTLEQGEDGQSRMRGIHMEATVLETSANEEGEPTVVYEVDKVEGGLFDLITQGIKLELFPPLIFLGVGALTDFGPLLANPRWSESTTNVGRSSFIDPRP